jgi:uncharacterized membrane protein
MKTLAAIFMLIALVTASGCWNTSNQGGTAPVNEEFSVTVPSSTTVKQGEEAIINISLKRGADFKRDVQLDLKTDGVNLSPGNILVKANDKPEVQIKINVPKDAAIGDYPVTVKGTPTSGLPASTTFTIKVVSQ